MKRVSKFGFCSLNALRRYELGILWDLFGLLPANFIQLSFMFAVITSFYHSQADLFHFIPFCQKFGSIRADVIEQMRFKQRLRVIQTIEDTTKRNVVRTSSY